MKKIKFIEIIFENCEVAKLLPNMFKHLILNDISKTKNINCFQFENGEYQDMLSCNYFYIEINTKGCNVLTDIGKDKLSNRIFNHKDICAISIIYKNNKSEVIYVPWNDKDEYINTFQKKSWNTINQNLIVEIERK